MEFKTVGSVLATRKMSVLIYGESGVGKTSLLKTLPFEPSEILYVAADPGQLALGPNKMLPRDMRGVSMVSPKTAEEFAKVRDYIVDSAAKRFKVVWIDGLDQIGEDMLRLYKDRERKKGARANIQTAYGDMAEGMVAWITDINRSSLPVVFTSHMDDDPQRTVRYSFSFPGKAARLPIENIFDEILCMRIAKVDPFDPKCEAERLIQTTRNRDVQYFAKERSGLLDDFEKPNMAAMFGKIFGKKE